MERNTVGVEEDIEGVTFSCHGGENKDTGVMGGDVTASSVCTCV